MKTSVSGLAVLLFLVLAAQDGNGACSVSATGVSFGGYDVFANAPLASTGSITVSCNEHPPPDVVIAIGTSRNSGGFRPRKMNRVGGPDLLDYNLFTDSSRAVVWGDGSGGTSTMTLRKVQRDRRNRPPATVTVYGEIPPGQNVSVGPYSDVLTVTITW